MNPNEELVRRIARIEQQLDNLVRPELGYSLICPATAYTNTDFDGDSFSTVAARTKIENSDWSTTVPTSAQALLLRVTARDSGSAGSAVALTLYSASAAGIAYVCRFGGVTNDYQREWQIVMPCTDGDLWYTLAASGAGTMDVWMWVMGWWS